MPLSGSHDPALVALAIAVSVVASFTALDLAARGWSATGRRKAVWLGAGAFAMGTGIWSMHFIAMLAFTMPGITVGYDAGLTLASYGAAVASTALGFALMTSARGPRHLLVAGCAMGAGITAMHSVGMTALEASADLSYDLSWKLSGAFVAVVAATVALKLAARPIALGARLCAAVALGVAVSAMHFLAMAGVHYVAKPCLTPVGAGIGRETLALAVAGATLMVLTLALMAAMVDRRLAALAVHEAALLRVSEERFRAFFTHAPLPLCVLDEAARLTSVTATWLNLLGYPLDAVLGRTLSAFVAGEVSALAFADDWARLASGVPLADAPYRLARQDGGVVEVLVSGRREVDPVDGRALVILGLVDVTERRRIEEDLRQSQKLEAVGQLTGGVAHDFNNLLAVVVGSLDLLRKRLPDDARSHRLVDGALQAARRGSSLTQRMLAFARKQDLAPRAVDLSTLIFGMSELLQRAVGPSIRIVTRFPMGLPAAFVDANQLEMALLNLAVNARDAMPEGGSIVISADGPSAGDGFVRLQVSDTGPGMDEATLARAREPFFTTKGVGKGTGLGLSMVHGLALQSGGRLMLSSAPGEGLTAELLLPVAGQAEQPPALELPPEDPPASRPLTILLVDDDPLVSASTLAMLEDLGHAVVAVSSGAGALAALDDHAPFDLVISDFAMPEMTGLQLAGILAGVAPGLPVLIASGYADLPEGVQGFARLAKPFSQSDLVREINRLVHHLPGTRTVIDFQGAVRSVVRLRGPRR